GLNWCVTNNVRILSMSLGLTGWNPFWLTLMDRLREQNILPIIAVGNEGPGTSRSPGNYPNVLSVGAVDQHLKVADFSSSEVFQRDENPLVPLVVAPGVGIPSCVPQGKYLEMDGTSIATPHVAGVAALLMQALPDSPVDDIEQAILQNTTV